MFNHFIPPMLLSEKSQPFDDDEYIFEIKFDGIRAVVHADASNVRIFTRNGNEISDIYPELQKIKEIVKGPVIFDGEIIALDKGLPSFSKLQRRHLVKNKLKIATMSIENPVVFVAFDCLYDGKNLCELPLMERKKILECYPDTDVFVKTKYTIGKGKKIFREIAKKGLEGIVAKKKTSKYFSGYRTTDWIKIKNYHRDSFLIGGLRKNKASVSLLLGEYRDKDFCFVGKVNIMKDNPLYKKLKATKCIESTPFGDYDEQNVLYFKPIISCEVSYLEKMANGHLRHPVLKKDGNVKL